jgi:hypothetical protein
MAFTLRPARRVAVLAAAFLAAVATVGAAPAHADSQTTRDPARDVRGYTSPTWSVPIRKDAARDLLAATARYRSGKVVVVVGLRDLKRSGYRLSVLLKSEVGTFQVDYDAETAPPSISYHTWVGQTRSCPSAVVRPRPARDSVKVALGRGCVGGRRARWIRFGIATYHQRSDGATAADDVRRDNNVDLYQIRLGGRLHYN